MRIAVLVGLIGALGGMFSAHDHKPALARAPRPPKPLSESERRAIEGKPLSDAAYAFKYAGRPFVTVGTAFQLPETPDRPGFQESRAEGAAVNCSSVVGPRVLGQQIRLTGVLESPVFTGDEGVRTFYTRDCALSR